MIYVLYAHRLDFEHVFTEHFTSLENLDAYIDRHPEVALDSIGSFELNPR